MSRCCNKVDQITTLWYEEEKKVKRGYRIQIVGPAAKALVVG